MDFDTFSVLIDTSNNKNITPLISYQSVMSNTDFKITIISYISITLEDLMPKESNGKEIDWINRTTILTDFPISFDVIAAHAKSIGDADILMVIGAESLCSTGVKDSLISVERKKYHMRLHTLHSENWEEITNKLITFYECSIKHMGGLIFVFGVDHSTAKKISSLLDRSNNMSIMVTDNVESNEDYEKIQLELIEKLATLNINDGLKLIESYESILPKWIIIYQSALLYFKNGDTTETIKLLESLDSDDSQIQLFLADLYMNQNDIGQAYKKLMLVSSVDKYAKGLTNSLTRYYQNKSDEEKEAFIKKRKAIDPDNTALIEFEASYLSSKGAYADAAILFRGLKDNHDESYYELVARINDLLDNPPEPKVARAYIDGIIYDNLHIWNEGLLRMSRYFLQHRDSPYMAYQTLQDADDSLYAPKSVEVAKEKLNLLNDNFVASKALRKLNPYAKAGDAQKLIDIRSETLLINIPVLATQKNGFLIWRDYIDSSQSEDVWKSTLFSRAISELKQMSNVDYPSLLVKSAIRDIRLDEANSLTCENNVYLLRKIKGGEFSDESIPREPEAFAQQFLTIPILENDIYHGIVSRYYISIIFSIWGYGQDANNYALSVFDMQEQTDDLRLKTLALYLGLLSWGFSQYKLGLHVEGVACILSTVGQLQSIDATPFLEEGVTIICKFILDNKPELPEPLVLEIIDGNEHLFELNPTFALFQGFLSQNKEYLHSLATKIQKNESHDVDWAVTVGNLISLLAKDKQYTEARKLIDAHALEVVAILDKRQDIRWQTIYTWAQCIFFTLKNADDFDRIISLMELAIEDCERRRIVAHKTERGALAASFQRLYRYHLNILGIYYGMSDVPSTKKTELKDKILMTSSRLIPRAVIEQHTYLEEGKLSDDFIELDRKYQNTVEEYNNLLKNNTKRDYLDKKEKSLAKIREELTGTHPNYKFLNNYDTPKWDELRGCISKNSIIFQYLLLDMVSINIIIDNEDIYIYSQMFSASQISTSDLKQLLNNIYNNTVQSKHIDLVNQTTELITHGLSEYLRTHTCETIYVMPDFSLGMYSLISGTPYLELASDTKSQINILDYKSAITPISELNHPCRIGCGLFGNPNDPALRIINAWLKENESNTFTFSDYSDESVELWLSDCNEFKTDIAFIFGHGVHDLTSKSSYGALGVRGRKRIIPITELIDTLTAKVLFIISCSGGTPSSDNPESSTGIWVEVVEHFSGTVVLCKWDVEVNATLKLIDSILDKIYKKVPISIALLESQREQAHTDFTRWAGLELWQN